MLKLYLYRYLQQVRSSRRLETERRRNVEAMWQQGILVHVPVKRAVNQQGDGALFDRSQFICDEKADTVTAGLVRIAP